MTKPTIMRGGDVRYIVYKINLDGTQTEVGRYTDINEAVLTSARLNREGPGRHRVEQVIV